MIGFGQQQSTLEGHSISALSSWPHTCDDAEMLDVGAHANESDDVFMTKLPKKPKPSKYAEVSIARP